MTDEPRDSKESAEQTRESAEQTKESAEQTKESAEQTKESAEQTKESAEQTKESAEQTKESAEQTKESAGQTKESAEQTKESAEQTKESAEQTKESAEQTIPSAIQTKPKRRLALPDPRWQGIAIAAMFAAAGLGYGISQILALVGVLSPWLLPGCVLVAFGGAGVAIGRFSTGRPAIEAGAAAVLALAIGIFVIPIEDIAVVDGRVIASDVAIAFGLIFGGAAAWALAVVGALAGVEMRREVEPGEPDSWDRAAAWLADRGAPYALVALTLAALAIHFGVFVGETAGDDLTFHFAESARLADCLRVGDFDFWNPSANAGYASAYYYQVVPQLASALPAAIFGHHLFWFQLSVVLPLVLAPAAAYRGMRLMGATQWQAVLAAFVIAFMNGQSRWGTGNAGTFQVGLYTQTWALAAFPLALGHGARWISEGEGLAPAIAWGAMVGMCHPFAVIALGIALTVPIAVQALLALLDPAFAWIGRELHPHPSAKPRPAPSDWIGAAFAGVIDCGRAVLARWQRPTERAPIAAYTQKPLATSLYWIGGIAAAVLALTYAAAFALDAVGRLSLLPFAQLAILIGGSAIVGYASRGKVIVEVGLALVAVTVVAFLLDTDAITDWWKVPIALVLAQITGMVGAALGTAQPRAEVRRWAVLGTLMVIASMPWWLPLLVDWDGFGGFPHRVDDEVGPGFWGTPQSPGLMRWYYAGWLLDFSAQTFHMLTYALPIVILFARGKFMRWLWAPALVFATALALGPHMSKTQDDLLPMVRFLGAMQVVLGLGIGAGAVVIAAGLWRVTLESTIGAVVRVLLAAAALLFVIAMLYSLWADEGILLRLVWRLTLRKLDDLTTLRIIGTIPIVVVPVFAATPVWRALGTQYGARTMLCAIGAALLVLVAVPGAGALASRVRVMGDDSFRSEREEIDRKLATLPPGRKQVGPGAENHWWNLLSYAYVRVPATLQMGGGGLQASPNYDFLWSNHDYVKNAHIYDAPYLVFQSARGNNMPMGETLLKTNNYELRKLVGGGLVAPAQIVGVLPPGTRKNEPGHTAALKWLGTNDPMQDRLLVYAGFGGKGPPPDGKVLRAWRQDSPSSEPDIVADVDARTTTTFVVRESWHPRWHAYIDGAEAAVMRVTPDFLAVEVPPGKHELAMRFERPWWAQAAYLAWPGVPLAAWLLLRRARRSARRRPVAA